MRIQSHELESAVEYEPTRRIIAREILDAAEKIGRKNGFSSVPAKGNYAYMFFGETYHLAKNLKLALFGEPPTRVFIHPSTKESELFTINLQHARELQDISGESGSFTLSQRMKRHGIVKEFMDEFQAMRSSEATPPGNQSSKLVIIRFKHPKLNIAFDCFGEIPPGENQPYFNDYFVNYLGKRKP